MITCPHCNTQNEEGAAFCDQCGATLTGANAAAILASPAAALDAGTSICPVCGAEAMPGDAFCNECGAALSAEPAPQPSSIPVVSKAASTPGAQIVINDDQSVTLAGKTNYLIGREDPMSGIYPEVDTTHTEGDVAGVSRRHAEIVQQSNQWFLTDLNSTNGTFVNNQRVAPNTRCLLHSGDQIRLGKWVATFQVK